MKQTFRPMPGKIAVVREASVTLKRMEAAGLEAPETAAQYERRINPWALVVGVGPSRVTDTGRLIETDLVEGNKVMVGEVGRDLPLYSADGEQDFIYVLPFEGVLGVLEYGCEKCEYTLRWCSKTEDAPNPATMTCPQCPKLQTATLAEVAKIARSKRR